MSHPELAFPPRSPFEPDVPRAAMQPVQLSERIPILDVLRGFALFGVFLVNMPLYNSPLYLPLSGMQWWPSAPDRAVVSLVQVLFQGKFIAIFSFLFGLGLTLQFERARARRVDPAAFCRRRLSWLLLIGLAHALLVWFGDILVMYALVGLLLIRFRNRTPAALSVWTVVLLLTPLLLTALYVGDVELDKLRPASRERVEQRFAEIRELYPALTEQAHRAYTTGSVADVMLQRTRDVGQIYSLIPYYLPYLLGLFLIGLNIGRRGLLRDVASYLPQVRTIAIGSAVVGLVGHVIRLIGDRFTTYPAIPSPWLLLGQVGSAFGEPALGCCYVCVVILLYHTQFRSWLAPLGPVGRMALSNYLGQSLLCTCLFNPNGFGLYGRVSPRWGVVLVVLVFALQVGLSRWWLTRFRFGPAEWVWRSLTYGSRQPMRLAGAAPA